MVSLYNKNQVKEIMIHSLWDCYKIKDLPENVKHELGIVQILQLPLTSQQLIIHEHFCDRIWMLTVWSMLSAGIDKSPIKPTVLAAIIKAEIKSINKVYPNMNLAHDCGYLNLADFLANKIKTVSLGRRLYIVIKK